MPTYRKKLVEIEAFQLTPDVLRDPSRWPEWANVLWVGGRRQLDGVDIATREGTMRAGVNDWVLRGVHGELYPCKPDIFEATYDAV